MTWVVSILAAFISGLAGMFAAGWIASACVEWYQISSREGESGFFIIFWGLAGGVVGFLLGLVCARVVAWKFEPGFLKELGGGLFAILVAAALVALFCRLFADITPKLDGQELMLQVEFRFPSSASSTESSLPPTSEGDWDFHFASLSGTTRRKTVYGIILTEQSRFENGQWIVPTEVELFTQRGRRSVLLARRDAKEVMGFILPLPSPPGKEYEQWSDWMPRQQASGEAWPDDTMSFRFRVSKLNSSNSHAH